MNIIHRNPENVKSTFLRRVEAAEKDGAEVRNFINKSSAKDSVGETTRRITASNGAGARGVANRFTNRATKIRV